MNTENAFYTNISEYYDHIFPYNPNQLKFVKDLIQGQEVNSVLDIGCGTGNLALELASEGYNVYAVDSDSQMITNALDKKRGWGLMQYPRFRELNMEKLSRFFNKDEFDFTSCFGNTLPHLLSFENIEEFLKSVSIVVKSGSHFAIQILNYDYILDNHIEELPVIENDHLRFERYYEYPENSELIDFRTKLTIKNEDEILENHISLFPVQKNDLNGMLEEAGFRDISFYSDFDKTPLKKDSLPLVIDCVKK
jgi:ubiquinone/menaquinone biosynthesis C-methylase UbiE